MGSIDMAQLSINGLCTIAGIVFGYVLKREIRIATLEIQFKNIDDKLSKILKDIDSIALFVGTPRALATKAKNETQGGQDGKSI